MSQAERRVATISDTAGHVAACGVPTDVAVRVSAATAPGVRNGTTLAPDSERVRFLPLALAAAKDSASVGVLRGTVRGSHGQPVAGAHVTVGDSITAETDVHGAYRAARVPPGTHHMEVVAIGTLPAGRTVDVRPGDSTVADITVSTVTSLDAATIVGTRSARRLRVDDLRRRQELGIGHFLDSTTVGSYLTITEAISSVESTAHMCALYIDGTEYEPGNWGDLKTRNTRDIGVIETHHLSDPSLPNQFRSKWCRSFLSVIVVIWTRAALDP